MAVAQRRASQTPSPQHLHSAYHTVRTIALQNTMAGAQRQASQTSSPQHLQCDLQGPPAATTRAAAPSAVSGDCAGHCGESRAPSGDNARRSPFCAGHCGGSRAPSGEPLLQSLETAPATAERAGPPAAPSAVSGDCAGHCGESRAPSGDNARRSPFCSLWRLRRPLRREPGPQRRQRAGHCGCEV